MAVTLFYIYLFILIVDIIICVKKYSVLDTPLKILSWILALSLVGEIIMYVVNLCFHTKAPVSHFFNIAELSLIGLYFLFSVNAHPRKLFIFLIPAVSCLLGLGNLFFLQPIMVYNTNMLLSECVLCIAMALYALFSIMKKEDVVNIFDYPHFRIWISFLVLWTGTFFFWAFLSYLKKANPFYYDIASIAQTVLNICFYAYIGITYSKLSNELK